MKIEDPLQIVLIAHNLRSCSNVGSLLRTAEGLGVNKVYLTGYTPYPEKSNDTRLPHEVRKINNKIHKTALGAENLQNWQNGPSLKQVVDGLKLQGYEICGLEQHDKSIKLNAYEPGNKVALLLGREVEGLEPESMALCDKILEIPMFGKKESFNVVQAAAMAVYHFRFGLR